MYEITAVGNLIIILNLLEPEVMVTRDSTMPCSGSCFSCHFYELLSIIVSFNNSCFVGRFI